MLIEELRIRGGFLVTPKVHGDARGVFLEWYRHDALTEAVGHPLTLAQANCSVSTRGVIRGIHFADVPPGQAKYVTCLSGAILDVIVDVRLGSPTFGEHVAVRLDDEQRQALYLAEGLGHGFCVLSETATVAYLCSTVFNPEVERGIDPTDPDLDLPWPTDIEPVLSDKDCAAPSLSAAQQQGILPTWQAYLARQEELR